MVRSILTLAVAAVALAAWFGLRVRRSLSIAHTPKVRTDLVALAAAAEEFWAAHLRWPESAAELVTRDANGYSFLKLTRELLDLWERPYVMECLSDHEIRVGTLGRDGVPGGEGVDSDLWESARAASER